MTSKTTKNPHSCMRVAYLILAHKNEKQIRRMMDAVASDDCKFFIHIDVKSEMDISDFLSNEYDVAVCKKRYNIDLYSYEMVKATLTLIDLAMNDIHHFDYYVLLSGQDYPITCNEYRVRLLKESYPKSFIDITSIENGNWVDKSFAHSNCFKRLRTRNNEKAREIHNKYLRYVYKAFFILPFKLASYAIISPKKVLDTKGIKMYGGSQWWILSDKAIEAILTWYSGTDIAVKRAFKRVTSPDETFFQTCLMNSFFGGGIPVSESKDILDNQTFTIFQQNGHPIVFTINEIDKIIRSKKLFARKFDVQIDSDVLDEIDKRILGDM